MFKHFQRIARQMGGESPGNSRAEAPRIEPERERAKLVSEWIGNAAQLLPAIGDPVLRYDLHRQVTQLLKAFEGETMIEPDF